MLPSSSITVSTSTEAMMQTKESSLISTPLIWTRTPSVLNGVNSTTALESTQFVWKITQLWLINLQWLFLEGNFIQTKAVMKFMCMISLQVNGKSQKCLECPFQKSIRIPLPFLETKCTFTAATFLRQQNICRICIAWICKSLNGSLFLKVRDLEMSQNLDQTSVWLQNRRICIFLAVAMEYTQWMTFGGLVWAKNHGTKSNHRMLQR